MRIGSDQQQTDLAVVDEQAAAASLLDPVRLRVLERLTEPDSAAGVARRLGEPRQRIGYHVKALEKQGLLRHVEDRRRGNCLERVLVTTARRFVISPAALGKLGADPKAVEDAVSSSYLIAAASEIVRDVAILQKKAREAELKLPTITLQTEIRFRSAADRNTFAQELARFLADAVVRYHNDETPDGRRYRFFLGGYPAPGSNERSGG